jgi:hypothetical protein
MTDFLDKRSKNSEILLNKAVSGTGTRFAASLEGV